MIFKRCCAFTGHRPKKLPWGYDETDGRCIALRLHCVLPCQGQADGWPASARERYRSIPEQADEVVYVSQGYREGCMLERDRYLVEHAACLLAVYNGEHRGGTAMTVWYARKLGWKIVMPDPG